MLNIVPYSGVIYNKSALVQVMDWHQLGDKPLSKSMILRLLMIIFSFHELTRKQLERHGFILSTVATDALMLKHQTISNYSAD